METVIRKLNKDDYDALFEVLTKTFENKYKRPVYFDREQPKMWVRDDEHMARHTGVFEDGKLVAVIGVYPLPCVIDGEEFLFFTTGNVATLPGHEGRGYFTKLFNMAMEEIAELSADGARLGGSRQRYGRYGFEGCGQLIRFALSDHNAKYSENKKCEITLEKIEKDDVDTLKYCYGLMKKKPMYVNRSTEENYRDMYLALTTKSMIPYLARRSGKPIGYLCISADYREIGEFSAESAQDLYDSVCAVTDFFWETHISIPPYMTEELRLFYKYADNYDIMTPSRFKLLSYERLTNRLIKMKSKYTKLSDFEYTIDIDGKEKITLYSRSGECGCRSDERAADVKLCGSEAMRLLFGAPDANLITALPCELGAILPLPLTWSTLDYV